MLVRRLALAMTIGLAGAIATYSYAPWWTVSLTSVAGLAVIALSLVLVFSLVSRTGDFMKAAGILLVFPLLLKRDTTFGLIATDYSIMGALIMGAIGFVGATFIPNGRFGKHL